MIGSVLGGESRQNFRDMAHSSGDWRQEHWSRRLLEDYTRESGRTWRAAVLTRDAQMDDRFQREYCGDHTSTGHFLFYKKAIEQRLSAR